MRDIYLDFNASTPVAPEVAEVMRHALETGHGNPSSGHWAGVPARQMVEVQGLRDHFWAALRDAFGARVVLNGHPERRLPNTLNVAFVGRVGAEILAAIPEIAASTGSACHSGRIQPSPVLEAMGVAPQVGMGAIRFSLGRTTTADEVDHVAASLRRVLL